MLLGRSLRSNLPNLCWHCLRTSPAVWRSMPTWCCRSEPLRKPLALWLTWRVVGKAGRWQSFAGVAAPLGEARPAWKVLRVLGNLLELPDCHYLTSEAIRDELAAAAGNLESDNLLSAQASARADGPAEIPAEDLDVPMYQVDAVVRRARSLQLTRDGRQAQHGATERRETA